jgi:cation diffusion facilitator family transporter
MRRNINNNLSCKSSLGSVFVTAIIANLSLAVLKFGIGIFGYTKLVLMDGILSFLNTSLIFLMWYGNNVEEKNPDDDHPYGYGKAIFLITSVAGFALLVIAIYMFFYSINNMGWLEVHRSHSGAMMVTVISIIANELLYRYLTDEGKRHSNNILAWNAENNRIDVLVSSLVLIFILSASLGAAYFERLGVAVISIIMFCVSLRILFKAFSGIMDKAPSQGVLNQIRLYTRKIKGVKEVLDIKARYIGTFLHIDLCISVDENLMIKEADRIAKDVETKLIDNIYSIREVNAIIA